MKAAIPRIPDILIRVNIPRIEPDDLGGWYAVDGKGKFGWLFGSRPEALVALRELTDEVR
jgi:hypothetical protein